MSQQGELCGTGGGWDKKMVGEQTAPDVNIRGATLKYAGKTRQTRSSVNCAEAKGLHVKTI